MKKLAFIPDVNDLIPLNRHGRPTGKGWFGHNRTRKAMSRDQAEQHLAKGGWLGLRTGWQDNGLYLVVIDCDVKNGVDGIANYKKFVKPELLNTTQVETPSGGRHYYYYLRGPHQFELYGNRVDLIPGVDVRAQGGYVVLPAGELLMSHDDGSATVN